MPSDALDCGGSGDCFYLSALAARDGEIKPTHADEVIEIRGRIAEEVIQTDNYDNIDEIINVYFEMISNEDIWIGLDEDTRKFVFEIITAVPDNFAIKLADFIRNHKDWANDFTIGIFARLYFPVRIYLPGGKSLVIGDVNNENSVVEVYYNGLNHYQARVCNALNEVENVHFPFPSLNVLPTKRKTSDIDVKSVVQVEDNDINIEQFKILWEQNKLNTQTMLILKNVLQACGLSVSGSKATLIETLSNHFNKKYNKK